MPAAIQRQPDVAKAWQEEHARHREHHANVQKLFEHLPDLETYASEMLTKAIKQRFGLDLDVRNTYLVDARMIDTKGALDGRQAVKRATRSLLQCALHNFDQASAAERGMDAPGALLNRSVILDHRQFMGTVPITNTVSITAEAFADLCRTLDIGGKYHELVHAIYYPAATSALSADQAALRVYQTLGNAEVSAFRQSLHFARLKGDISPAFYSAALSMPADQPPSTNSPVTFGLLNLWETELTGIVVMQLNASGPGPVGLYTPGDNISPLKEFATWDALQAEFSARLNDNIHYLDQHIGERDKASVSMRLRERLTPLDWSIRGLNEPVADPHAALYPVARSFTYAFQGVMAFQKAERHEKDVLFHATPTEIVDRRTALAHREMIAGRLLMALNIAGFFVPGLGEAMLTLCVAQLAYEVYEGIEAWENDERDTAYRYLVDVIENVAVMAALSAAAKAIKGAKGQPGAEVETPLVEEPGVLPVPVETPSFIEELEDVEMPDGQVRLWKPDLAPYRCNEVLPENLEANSLGLRQHQGKLWLETHGDRYIVEQIATTGEYRLQHPGGPRRYSPPVRHNGAGAWVHVTERPATWTGTTLLRRIGHLSADFDEPTLQQIIEISGIHEDVLRRVLVENQRLPALLEDTLQRFKLDKVTRQLPDHSLWPTTFNRRYDRLPLAKAPGAEAIRWFYPKLPTAIANELVRNASTSEQQMLHAGKVPLRMAEEIRVYQQQIRLTRAYEGLYLDCVQTWDSDRLIMHSLHQLPGWPTSVRLELRQQRFWPFQSAVIGPADALSSSTISCINAGYLTHAESMTPLANLYTALFQALPEAMQQVGVRDAEELRRLLQQSPLSRESLREVLGMRPVRPGYRSPMRLADGRIGYPLSGGQPSAPAFSRQTLLDAVAATGLPAHTRRSAEHILMIVASRGRTQAQVLERLQELLEQRQELQSRLDDWYEGISPGSDQAMLEHQNVRDTIMQHWYDSALEEGPQHSAQLVFSQVSLADIPMNLPEHFTARVRRLRLDDLRSGSSAGWAQHERLLQRLLAQLHNLEELEITRDYNQRATPSPFLYSIGPIAQCLPGLRALTLTNQNIPINARQLTELAGLPELRYLDLSGNRFAQNDRPSLDALSLDNLGLDDMQLNQWPIGLGSETLGRIGHVSLRNNNLRSLPAFLLNNPDSALSHTVISLEGNDINGDHLQRLLLNESRHDSHINVDRSPEVSERLERIRNERQQLREAIDGWAQASSSSTQLTPAIVEDRQRIANAINQFWENQERGLRYLRLHLADVSLANFPRRLPAFFLERVNALTLSGASGSTEQLDELLGRFPNITRLIIDGHVDATQTLVSALARLPRLNVLEFRNMGLEIDQAMLEAFGRLRNLTLLDLSGNRMGVITDVPTSLVTSLTSLSLSNMGLQTWPAWCERLLPLELLDLSSNNISQLPDSVLHNLENPMPISSIALFDNPLALDTVLRLRAYSESQHSFTFALDTDNLLLTDTSSEGSLLDHPHFPLAGDDTPRVELWALGNEAQNEALRDCWETLQRLDDGANLLRLAGRLRNAAPYVDPLSQAAFCERVRMMLVIAATHDEMRPTMSVMAAEALPDPVTGAQTCHDGALQAFNNIELYIMNNRVLTDAGDTLQALFRRLRQLYRMGQLEVLASQRTAPGDHVSVRLAYRRDLASELDLPIADRMRFRSAAQLAKGELDSVLEQVRGRESSDAFMQYLMTNQNWTERLRIEHAERFARIVERFGERVQELSALDLPLQQELALQQGLQDDKDQEEKELLQDLTRPFFGQD
ncbi:DUF6543 domain-containing protein [Pseudomonas sp. BCRC 81390]|uniref:dermonecrotic toxin domain-containing protein n=1 Tax=Pseudomonas sp. BCRC 81390 TaxID=3054778 RepID=UPI00338D90BF